MKYGAKAVLIRTLAPNNSTSGPHTGTQAPYAMAAIPAACIAIEDAELLSRLSKRGHQLHATLSLPCHQISDRTSRNLVFEIRGTDHPEEVVLLGGHTDSWDCQNLGCQGAHDDGQGVVIALEIIKVLHQRNIRSKRTIRAVLFVDEEVTQTGAKQYALAHAHEAHNIVAAIETDLGVGPVVGFGFSGSSEGRETLRELLKPLHVLGDVCRVDDAWEGSGVDITPLIQDCKVPGLLLRHADSWWYQDYFHLHHSSSDTIDHVDKNLLKQNFGVLLGAVLLLANSDCRL